MKLVVVFPGVGYQVDRPLLYYARKLFCSEAFEVKTVEYGKLPKVEKLQPETIDHAIDKGIAQTQHFFSTLCFSKYEKIIFISKSIGTAIASRVCAQQGIEAIHICFTPLAQTFDYPIKKAVVFHGTNDPWAKTEQIKSLCKAQALPIFLTEGANHSLEKEDVLENIEILYRTMAHISAFLQQELVL